MKLRSVLLALVAAPLLLAPVSAANMPGYTAADQKMFDKLNVLAGTWHCTDTPASKKPDVMTIARQGAYFVQHETGDNPSITYYRWSHTFQRYFANSINQDGGMNVQQTMSQDPNNGTWTYAFPTSLPKGKLYPVTVSLSGNTLTASGQYMDSKGNVQTAKSVCTKQ